MPEPHQRPTREFEQLVNQDLRDKRATGSAYKILSRRENLVRWLRTLDSFSESIKTQAGHDKAILDTHPDKPNGGEIPESYAEAKRELQERKRRRDHVMQNIIDRKREVRDLIGNEGLTECAAGDVIDGLLAVQHCLADGRIEDASRKIECLIDSLTPRGSDA